MESRKRGEVSLAQETSEDSMSASYFSVQPTEPPAHCRRGGVSPSSPPAPNGSPQAWGVPRLGETEHISPRLRKWGSPVHTLSLSPPKEEPEGHLWEGGAPNREPMRYQENPIAMEMGVSLATPLPTSFWAWGKGG